MGNLELFRNNWIVNPLRSSLVGLALLPMVGGAQTTREEVYADLNRCGGVYYAYPVTTAENTPAPKGYEPFYISHYGRHGSRYLISDKDYAVVIEAMEKAQKAGVLTELGKSALERLHAIWPEAEGMGGALSPVGVQQQRGIAQRMFQSFPQVFQGNAFVEARATTSIRVVLTMDAFCERLKEFNPALRTTRESNDRWQRYLNHHTDISNEFTGEKGPWREEYRKFEAEHTRPERMMKALFTDAEYVRKNVNPHDLMWGFYWVTVDMQDMVSDVSFLDLWEPDEIFDLWQAFNYRFYVCDGPYAGSNGLLLANAKPLVRNIVATADSVINLNAHGATLRFGHDGNLIPLAGQLQIDDCYNSTDRPEDFYKNFADWKIAPMAGNIQLVFYHKTPAKKKGKVVETSDDDILVKIMLNERERHLPIATDQWPFYHWKDVREHLLKQGK